MTMKVTEHSIVTEVKRHPNDVRYPCRGTHEIMDAGRKLITALSLEERQEMKVGTLILDEEETGELFDSILVGDVIGLGIFRGKESDTPGFTSNMYEVEKIHVGQDYMECKNYYTKSSEEISFQDFSIGLAMNLAEILYRDEKPFGAPTERKWTVNIHEEVKDEETEADANSEDVTGGDPISTGDSLVGDEEVISADNQPVAHPENGLQPTTLKTGPSDTVNVTLTPEAPPDPMKPLIWPACYHAFGYIEDTCTYVVMVNFRTTWDETKTIDLDGREEEICEKLGLERIAPGVYGYTHLYNETQLRQIFKSFRCDEVPYMSELLNDEGSSES